MDDSRRSPERGPSPATAANGGTTPDLGSLPTFLAHAFRNSSDWMSLCTLEEGRYLEANPAFLEGTGFTRAEVVGHTDRELGTWPDPGIHRAVIERLMSEGEVRGLPIQRRTREGELLATLYSGQVLEEGGQRLLLSATRDISRLANVEAAWRQSEHRYQRVLETANEGVWFIDADQRTSYVNPKMAAMLGVEPEAMLSCAPADFLFPEDLPAWEAHLATRRRGCAEQWEWRLRRADGRELWTLVSATPLMEDGAFVGSFAMYTDVTESRRAREALEHNEARLESLLRISQFKTRDPRELLDFALAEAVKLTGSRLGYIYRYHAQRAELEFASWFPAEMAARARRELPANYRLEMIGLWGEPVRQRRPVLINDFSASHPLKRGLPPDHPPVTRFLSLPLLSGEQVVAVVAVANKASDYLEGDQRQLALLMDAAWKIVERQETASELAKSERRFRSLVEKAPDAIFVQTRGRFAYLNPAAVRLFGASGPAELLGQPVLERFLPTQHELIRERIRRLNQERQEVPPVELPVRRLDGSTVEAEIFAVPFEHEGERGALAFARDQEKRKRAERALAASETRFRVLNEVSLEAMFLRSKEGIIDYVNPAAARLLGAAGPEELLGRQYLDFIPPEEQAESLRRIALNLAHRGAVPPREHHMIALDGRLVPVESSGVAFEHDGLVYVLGVMRDISERQRAVREKAELEERLRQAEKMEAIGTLAGGIAHEFNNLLSVIIGFTETAQGMTTRREDNRTELGQVLGAADRARRLVRQILTFSRKLRPERRPLDLNLTVEQVTRMLRPTLPRMIAIETKLAPDLWAVDADAGQMEQVLINLATNAADAMPEGGTLAIETRNLEVDEEFSQKNPGLHPGPHALLVVSDSGVGMDTATREQVFDPFFTTKGPGKGTGLGLATVYGIVKGHEGHIYCYSEPGLGTSFKVYLPSLGQASLRPSADVQPPEPLGGRETILLVDDEPALRELSSQSLADKGYTVIPAGSGEQALEIYRQRGRAIDLVILDLGMPGMGGSKCLQAILELDPRAKVLIASGYAPDGQVRAALQAGAASFVAKPFRRVELLTMVRRLLDQPSRP